MKQKGVRGALCASKGCEGCSGLLRSYVLSISLHKVGARAGLGCWAGPVTWEDLQLICHLDGSADDSNTHPTSAHREVRS